MIFVIRREANVRERSRCRVWHGEAVQRELVTSLRRYRVLERSCKNRCYDTRVVFRRRMVESGNPWDGEQAALAFVDTLNFT